MIVYRLLLLVLYVSTGFLLGCVPCVIRRKYGCFVASFVLCLWFAPALSWMYYSPLSACSPRIIHSLPANKSDDAVWESFWCSRPCTGRVMRPETHADLLSILRTTPHVRAVGAGHSTSDLQCSDDTVLSLDALCYMETLTSHITRFGAGCTVLDAQTHLASLGRQLMGYGSITTQRIGGAISTSLHGQHTRQFADHVVALTVALANGTMTRIEGVEVDAWLGSMGMLGVIVDVDLTTHPLEFVVCQRHVGNETHLYDALVDPTLAGFEARVMFSGDDFQSFVIRTCRRISNGTVNRTTTLTSLDDPFQAFVYDNVLLDWALFLGAAVPHLPGIDDAILASSPADTTVSGETVATVNDYRLPVRFHPHFDEEYAVPNTHCSRLMRQIATECIDDGMNAFFYIRRVDAARGWLTWSSTASCAVRVEFFRFTLDGVDVETRSRRCIEARVVGLGGSGHFGKPWFSSPHDMLLNSPQRQDFITYRNTLDPNGTFMTPYTRSLLHNVTYDRPPVLPPSLDTRLLVWRVLVGFNLVVTVVLSVFLCMDVSRTSRTTPPIVVTTTAAVKTPVPPRDSSIRRSRI